MKEDQALAILGMVRFALGRKYKSAIRQAWMDGNYGDHALSQWSCELQNIRNSFGPSWLVAARPVEQITHLNS